MTPSIESNILSAKYLYHSYVEIIKDIVKLGSTGTVKTTKLKFSNFDDNFVARFYEKLSKLTLHNIFIFWFRSIWDKSDKVIPPLSRLR